MRCIFWKHRLKYVIAVLLCFCITLVVYQNLPDEAFLPSEKRHIVSNKVTRNPIIPEKHSLSKILTHDLTVIFREFEDFENTLSETVANVENVVSAVDILVIADTLPYPPLNLSHSRSAHVLRLSSDLSKNYSSSCLLHFLKTEFVLFLPDAVKMDNWHEIRSKVTTFLTSNDDVKAVAIQVGNEQLECSALKVNLKEWTVSLQGNVTKKTSRCSYVQGMHALLMRSETLKSLAEPFARPFPYTFYVQAALKNWNIDIFREGRFSVFHDLFKDFHSSWKHKQAQSERLIGFYKKVGIKREVSKSGISEYYGCTKQTSRCFGTVIKDMPQYLYEGRWTPPCCLRALRESVAHVIGILDKCKVRYWLEGGSLLGAARLNDIIPWDYDVDVGVYQDDLMKCHHLKQAQLGPFIDDEDYVWEKAREGDFLRVQYSETNHLHVDIFPFYSKNGIMTKNTWFPTHRQDTEFPESFLVPLTKIKFAGIEANAPNNVRKFLEYKFGKNVIENPRYPNFQSPVL